MKSVIDYCCICREICCPNPEMRSCQFVKVKIKNDWCGI